MKLVHVPFCFYPDEVGGTEIYVAALAREQQRQGCEVLVCAPGAAETAYLHEGLPVRRFRVDANVADIAELYDAGNVAAAGRFGRILDEEQPDIVHLHAFTRGSSLRLIHAAKSRGIRTVFSYHTPTVSCMRGTLLRNGAEVCDGFLDVKSCAACNMSHLAIPRPITAMLGNVPPNVSRVIGRTIAAGAIATALRMTELVELRHSAFRTLMSDVDHVIALCRWTQELLVLNGVPAENVSLSRQGISQELLTARIPRTSSADLRVAFLGRLAPEKGLSLLLDALRTIPSTRATLDVYGIYQTAERATYSASMSDGRVKFLAPLTRLELLSTLQSYDVLAVPSQWLETGPMVVMEAFAAGIPVVGSRLGGIAELIDHNVNGLLIEPASISGWAAAIEALASDRSLLDRLRAGVKKPRTMRQVATEVHEVYTRIVPHRVAAMAGSC